MALMIFMQKWCWFHFPKYYSFILQFLFYTGVEARVQSQHLLPAGLLLGLCVRSRAAVQRGARGARAAQPCPPARTWEEAQPSWTGLGAGAAL